MTNPSDRAIHRATAATLRDIVLPAVDDDWARRSVIQLIALAELAGRRDDPHTVGEHRRAELRAALDRLAGNPLVPWPPAGGTAAAGNAPDTEETVVDACGRALAAAVADDGPDADAVRAGLRPLLLAHLDDDLAVTASLEGPFRGRLDDA